MLMKKIILSSIFLSALLMISDAGIARAEYDASYYSAMEGKKSSDLKSAAKLCVQKHTELVYMDLPNYWIFSDVYPELVNGQKRWWEMYSNEVYLIRDGQSGTSSFSANRMQREHSVPKSWWKYNNDVEYTPAYSDMWNLYPSDGSANMAKSNYPLGIVASGQETFDNGCTKVGIPAAGYGGGSGMVFEPDDEYKGDFARGFFYMATVYDDIKWVSKYNWMFTAVSYPTLQPWAYNMLLQWARQDPVSQKERIRNDAVEKSQGNRNPFVDFPELAEYIWGTRTGEVFRISEQGGNVTPPITGDPELTAPVNDEALDFGQVAVGGSKTSWLVLKGKNFTSALSVRVGGAGKDMFNVETRTIKAADINSTGEYMLPIIFTPSAEGECAATLSIYDGGLTSSIRVNLRGEGCPLPTLSRLQALPAINVTDNSYTAVWEEAPETVDYYVLYRKRYLEDGYETEELQCDTNSWTITDRDPSVAESYQVSSSRLGFLSPLSNVITVESSGIAEVSGYNASIGVVEDGIVVLTDGIAPRVDVYDVSGRMTDSRRNALHGEKIPLSKGIYMVVISGKTPVKVIL